MGNSSGKMKVLHEEAAVVPPPAPENGTAGEIENTDKIESVTAAPITNTEEEIKTTENASDAETSAIKKKGKPLSWLKKLSFKKERKSKGSAEVPNQNTVENEVVEKKEENATEGETAAVVTPVESEANKESTSAEAPAAEPVVVESTPVTVESQAAPVTAVETPVSADVVVDSTVESSTKEGTEEKVAPVEKEPNYFLTVSSPIIEVHKEKETTTPGPTEEVVSTTTTPNEETVVTNGHQEETKGDDVKVENQPITNGINGTHDEDSDKPQTPTGDDVVSGESLKDVASLSRDLQSLEVNQ